MANVGALAAEDLNKTGLPKWHECFFDAAAGGHNFQQKKDILDALKTYQLLQPQPAAEFSYALESKGSLMSTTLQDSNGANEPKYFYYYEQSIWEGAPFNTFEKDAKELRFNIVFVDSSKDLPNGSINPRGEELVRIHVIPATVLRLYPGTFKFEDITSAQNQRSFDVKYVHSPALEAFRSQWQQFFLTHRRASRAVIDKKGKELEQRFLVPLQTG